MDNMPYMLTPTTRDSVQYCMVNTGTQIHETVDIANHLERKYGGTWTLCKKWITYETVAVSLIGTETRRTEHKNPHLNERNEAVYLFERIKESE